MNLTELIAKIGDKQVTALFMEYLMTVVGKAMKYDAIVAELDTKNCTIERIKEILGSEDIA